MLEDSSGGSLAGSGGRRAGAIRSTARSLFLAVLSKLEIKIILAVGLTLGLVLAALVAYATWTTRRFVIRQTEESATAVSTLILDSMAALMRSGNKDALNAYISQAQQIPGVDSVQVFRGEAVVRQFGPGATGHAVPVLPDSGGEFTVQSTFGHRSVSRTVVVRATDECLGCHDVAVGEAMGALRVTMSLEEMQRLGAAYTRGMLLAASATGLAVLVLLLVLLRQLVTHNIKRLSRLAQAFASGDLGQRVRIGSGDEIAQLAVALNQMADDLETRERALSVSNRQLRTLVQEMHHRIKNNLQTMADLLSLEMTHAHMASPQECLRASIARLTSIAAVHELLSVDHATETDIKPVAQRVLDTCVQTMSEPGQHIQTSVRGPDIYLPSKKATALALVISELVGNAMKHALAERDQGQVTVELQDGYGEIAVVVRDDGEGFPADFDPTESNGLGLRIARTLVEIDLGGTLELRNGQGAMAIVKFHRDEVSSQQAGGTTTEAAPTPPDR